MPNTKLDIIRVDSLSPLQEEAVAVLQRRVQSKYGPADPAYFPSEEPGLYNQAPANDGQFYDSDALVKDLSQSASDPQTLRHYLAVIRSGWKSKKLVGYGVVKEANSDYARIWDNAVKDLRPGIIQPNLLELGGAVVDPDYEHKKTFSTLVEFRRYDIEKTLGGYAVCVVRQNRSDVMSKVSEFGGQVVGHVEEGIDESLILVVFPHLDKPKFKYIPHLLEKSDHDALSPAILAPDDDWLKRLRLRGTK